ncbi:hypothetical protein [Methylobacterium nigriterrae]|uniref:hypothetical protein n=1 Tax=Methylobacterium nigriterrae TaxID=3127512 RepID=UPI003013FAD7
MTAKAEIARAELGNRLQFLNVWVGDLLVTPGDGVMHLQHLHAALNVSGDAERLLGCGAAGGCKGRRHPDCLSLR